MHICIHVCMYVNMYIYIYILCISIYVCVFIWNSSAFLIVSFYVFLSLLLCLPFIVSLFLLRAYWWKNPAIFKYDIRSILFVNLKLTQHWPSAVHQMGVNILLKCGSSSNAASHQRTKSLRTMPSIRFQSASKSAHTCSSRNNNNNNKKIHTEHKHTHIQLSNNNNSACNTDSYTHTPAYIHRQTHTHTLSRSYRERRLRNEPPAQPKDQTPQFAGNMRLSRLFQYRYLLSIAVHTYTYATDRRTIRNKNNRDTHTHDYMEKLSFVSPGPCGRCIRFNFILCILFTKWAAKSLA